MPSSIMTGRRSSIEIVNEILSVCDSGSVNKTAIMYRSNLSYEQLQRYLSILSARELIEKNSGGQFQTTAKGQKTLKKVSRAIRSLRNLREEWSL